MSNWRINAKKFTVKRAELFANATEPWKRCNLTRPSAIQSKSNSAPHALSVVYLHHLTIDLCKQYDRKLIYDHCVLCARLRSSWYIYMADRDSKPLPLCTQHIVQCSIAIAHCFRGISIRGLYAGRGHLTFNMAESRMHGRISSRSACVCVSVYSGIE